MASVKITDYTQKVENELSQRASVFLRMAADEVVSISTPNTPMKTGRLRMDVVKQVLGLRGKVIWGKGYAIFQESKQFRNYTTAGTGPHFARNAVQDMIRRYSSVAKAAGLIR